MNEYIRLPRSALEKIPSALHRGIFLYLLERADENGQLTISIRRFANEIGIGYQVLRTAIAKLTANATVNAIATQEATQHRTLITICDYECYIDLTNNQQRKKQRKVNAISNAITMQSKPTKFTPPTREEAQAYIDKMGFHWGNADTFIDWNESRGWKVGSQPMKDWKAAMRNWENRWKQKNQYATDKQQSADKYSARRGTNVGNLTESDYGGAF